MSSNPSGVERGAEFLVILLGVTALLFLSFAGDANVYGQTPQAPPLKIQGRNLYQGNQPAYLFGQGFWHAAVKGGFDFNAEADWYVPYRANLTRIKTVTTRILKSSKYTPENPWILLSTGKYDLNTFNETFWKRLDQLIKKNEATGRIVLLQIFDEVTMKKGTDAWDRHPLNPANNVNNLTNMPGKGQDGRPEVYDVTNTKLMDYYQRYIGRLLESTYKYGNVIFEICNEYSGTTVFLDKVLGWIQTFEKNKKVDLLVTNMSCTQKLWDHENKSSHIDLLDFWHAPRSIRTFKVEEIYNYVTSLRAGTTKPVFAGRIGLEPDKTYSSPHFRRVARSQLWAILMAGGVAASTKEDNNNIENGPPVYNIDDKWEAEGFLGMHTVLDNLWQTGVLTPRQDLILSKPFTQNWAATVGHEVLVYLLAPGGGTLALKNLPNGIYTVKVFALDPCQVQSVERFRITQGLFSIPIKAINEGDCVIWLTPEPFDVTSRWEEQNGLHRGVIEIRDIHLFSHTILLNGRDVSKDILPLFGRIYPLKKGVQIMTPWIKFPHGVYELEVWIHGPEMSDRSIMRMHVP